jgi:dihydrofolate reductase
MASLVLKMSVSLDGYVASADRGGAWKTARSTADSRDWTVETVRGAGALLLGATAFTEMAPYWPSASGPFAGPMNEIPKVVFSHSLTSTEWGPTTIVTGDLADTVTRLKAEHADGYLLALGGARFARSLVEAELIDEYRLVVHPVVLGAGERLFPAPLALDPVSTSAFRGGIVAHAFSARP